MTKSCKVEIIDGSAFSPDTHDGISNFLKYSTCPHLAALKTQSREFSLKPGEILFNKGDYCDYAYDITHGVVGIYDTLESKTTSLINMRFQNTFIGFNGTPRYTYTAIAKTSVKLTAYPYDLLIEKKEYSVEFLNYVIEQQLATIKELRQHNLQIKHLKSVDSVAAFIATLYAKQTKLGKNSRYVPMILSRSEIADYLGLTIETVSRSLSKLKKIGLIEFDSPKITRLPDIEAFEDFIEAIYSS